MSPLRPSSSISWSGSGIILATLLCRDGVRRRVHDGALGGETRIATILQANTGLRRRSLQQIALLANGIGRIVLIIAAIMLVLAPWGVDSADLLARCGRRSSASGSATSRSRSSTVALALADLRRRLCRHARHPALARQHLPAGNRARCRPAQLDPHRLRLSRLHRRGGARLLLSRPQPRPDRHRRRRAVGRHRLRPAVDRQQLRLRPDPADRAADPRRRLVVVGDGRATCGASACARPRSRPSTARP